MHISSSHTLFCFYFLYCECEQQATWGFLRYSLPMLMNLGIGGISFSGADVGGFAGNPDVELQTRWYQAAALTPFFRAHSSNDTARREPWLYGEPHVSNIRDAIRVRYTHMPYVVTQFRHANATGQAPLRPLLQVRARPCIRSATIERVMS